MSDQAAVRPMSEATLIDGAAQLRGGAVVGVLDALEVYYGHGFDEGKGGDVDGPIGHFYRFDRWIVVTDTLGFHSVMAHDDEASAIAAFELMESEHEKWEGD